MKRFASLALVLTASALGCGDSSNNNGSSNVAQGTEGKACFPNNTCMDGLTCMGGVCLKLGPGQGGAAGSAGQAGAGGASGSAGMVGDAGGAGGMVDSECLTDVACTEDPQCTAIAGTACNKALGVLRCYKVLCGGMGSPCSDTDLCKTGLQCIAGICADLTSAEGVAVLHKKCVDECTGKLVDGTPALHCTERAMQVERSCGLPYGEYEGACPGIGEKVMSCMEDSECAASLDSCTAAVKAASCDPTKASALVSTTCDETCKGYPLNGWWFTDCFENGSPVGSFSSIVCTTTADSSLALNLNIDCPSGFGTEQRQLHPQCFPLSSSDCSSEIEACRNSAECPKSLSCLESCPYGLECVSPNLCRCFDETCQSLFDCWRSKKRDGC